MQVAATDGRGADLDNGIAWLLDAWVLDLLRRDLARFLIDDCSHGLSLLVLGVSH